MVGYVGRSDPARKGSVDYSRIRKPFQGKPTNYISYGVVGHLDQNPAFSRVENGKILVEVTLTPSGEEVIAELGLEANGGGWGFYWPVEVGCRVIVGFAQGEDPVIIKRITDAEFPVELEVAGISAVGGSVADGDATTAPHFAYIKTPEGALLAIETGSDGDISIKSGANVQIKVDPGNAIHLAGRTHIGVGWTEDPTGAFVGDNASVDNGESARKHNPPSWVPTPVPNSPLSAAPGTPATGVVRIKDPIQSDSNTDPAFWTYFNLLYTFASLVGTAWNTAATLGGPLIVPTGVVVPFTGSLPPVPTVIGSRPKTASLNTVGDT